MASMKNRWTLQDICHDGWIDTRYIRSATGSTGSAQAPPKDHSSAHFCTGCHQTRHSCSRFFGLLSLQSEFYKFGRVEMAERWLGDEENGG